MLSPFDSNKNSGDYINLQKRIFQRIQSAEINNQIIEVVRKSYADALSAENIELDDAESKRLLSQVLKLTLEEMTKKLDDGSIKV